MPEALHQVVDSGALYTVQSVYNLVIPSAGDDVVPGFDMPDFGKLIDRGGAKQMGMLVIRVLLQQAP